MNWKKKFAKPLGNSSNVRANKLHKKLESCTTNAVAVKMCPDLPTFEQYVEEAMFLQQCVLICDDIYIKSDDFSIF